MIKAKCKSKNRHISKKHIRVLNAYQKRNSL